MRRRISIVALVSLLALPASAFAKIDIDCPYSGSLQSSPSATTAIEGHVRNTSTALQGMRVELYTTNRTVPTADYAITDANGFYRICTGEKSGSYYDTFDVHVREQTGATAPLYATANQPYSTYLGFATDADFTPESGYPLLYMANLSVSPQAISVAAAAATVTWTVRSKAPAGTIFPLTLGYPSTHTVTMTPTTAEGGGPSAGGWNRWVASEVIPKSAAENRYISSVKGFSGPGTVVTQTDVQPYSIDNSPLAFGTADATICGAGVFANGFFPGPPGTTNHSPLVTQDICDPPSNGARSGPDPYSLRGWKCPTTNPDLSLCTEISPVLSTRTITWHPSAPLADGTYYFRWRIADYAGNVSNSAAQTLVVGNNTGQRPWFTGLSPGNFGSGNTGGLIIGSSLTSPSSFPTIGFRVLDADGQSDISPGSVHLRVFYGDNHTLVYDYDPTLGKSDYDALSKRGGGDFDLSTGLFKAAGYALQGKPPGPYFCSASVTDFGGNNESISWDFLLVAAA